MADTPQNQGPSAGRERPIVNTGTLGNVAVGINADVSKLGKVKGVLKDIRKEVDDLKKSFKDMADAANMAGAAMPGGPSTSRPSKSGNVANIAVGTDSQGTAAHIKGRFSGGQRHLATGVASGIVTSARGAGMKAAASVGMKAMVGSAGGPVGLAASFAPEIIGAIGNLMGGVADKINEIGDKMDARIERGRQYALPASQNNLILQQRYGMSESGKGGVIDAFRKPLMDYKLGAGGITDILDFRLSTGMTMDKTSLAQMGRSVEALRASSGFTMSTQDVLAQQKSLMGPETANRMFFMLGTGPYGLGGKDVDPMTMRQQIVRNMGLTNQRSIQDAMKMGSTVRARMADAGIADESTQTSILEYAMQNAQFQNKGGKGFYDPSSKDDRSKLIGTIRTRGTDIEDNFALQSEETDREKVRREEEFMSRQIDDMSREEKYRQDVVRLLQKIDTSLQYAYKARQGYMGAFTKGTQTLFTGFLRGGGDLLSGMAGIFGDGPADEPSSAGVKVSGSQRNSNGADDSNISIPLGGTNQKITLTQLKSRSDFQQMHPRMKDRLLNVFRANPAVGWGGGVRSSSAQKAMFESRYRRTSNPTAADGSNNIFWDGDYWEHVSGYAAAPPGMSMHEIGLAADLAGDLNWLTQHAHEFGLQHFANVNNEPHHVQPSELPKSRRKYESQGAPWGTDGNFSSNREGEPSGEPSDEDVTGDRSSGSPFSLFSDTSTFTGYVRSLMGQSGSPSSTGDAYDYSTVAGSMSIESVAKLAHLAGFRGQALISAVAIAGRESGYRPKAHRTDTDKSKLSGDLGLWQINYANLTNSFMAKIGAKSRADLFNPVTNARAAWELSSGGTNWTPWGYTPGVGWSADGNPLAGTNIQAATQAVQNANLGDPVNFQSQVLRPVKRDTGVQSSSPSSVNYNSSPTINVSPVINFNGLPERNDLREIARTVTQIMKEEVNKYEMRTA